MTKFRRFWDRSLPGERLINLEAITDAAYIPGNGEIKAHLAIFFNSEMPLRLEGHEAVVIWGYLTALNHCSTIVMGEPDLELQAIDS